MLRKTQLVLLLEHVSCLDGSVVKLLARKLDGLLDVVESKICVFQKQLCIRIISAFFTPIQITFDDLY